MTFYPFFGSWIYCYLFYTIFSSLPRYNFFENTNQVINYVASGHEFILLTEKKGYSLS